MGFPSPASDYVERVLPPGSICTTAGSRILETSAGYAVVDPVTRLVEGEVLLILCGGRTQFAKFMGQSLICDGGEAIEGSALEETEVMGRVTYFINRVRDEGGVV